MPGAGWIGLDPTSGLFAGEGHIPLVCDAASVLGGADHRRHRPGRGDHGLRQHGPPGARGPAGHQALQRSAVGGRGRPGRAAGRATQRRRRAADHGRRAHLRLRRRHRHPAMGGRRRRPGEAGAGPATGRPAGAALGAGRRRPPRSGQVVPGRGPAALEHRDHLAPDGVPIWEDRSLLANPWDEPVRRARLAGGAAAVRDLAAYIAGGLGVPSRTSLPAFEDPLVDLLDRGAAAGGRAPSRPTSTRTIPSWPTQRPARRRSPRSTPRAAPRGAGWCRSSG